MLLGNVAAARKYLTWSEGLLSSGDQLWSFADDKLLYRYQDQFPNQDVPEVASLTQRFGLESCQQRIKFLDI